MTATPQFSEAIKYLDSLRKWLTELQSQAPEETPQFEVGQEVVVWETGTRFVVDEEVDKAHGEPRYYVPSIGQFLVQSRLLAIPTKPDDTEEYTVGEWARPVKGEDEGWLCEGLTWWFEGEVNESHVDQTDNHGYRWTITRVPKPKFEMGAGVRVRQTGRHGVIVPMMMDNEMRLGVKMNDNYRVEAYCESDLEPAAEALERLADEAPRQDLPDTPPKFHGREMRWKRDRDGNILYRGPHCDEHYLLRGEIAVWHYAHTSCHASSICEPAPVVQGWDDPYLLIEFRVSTGKVTKIDVTKSLVKHSGMMPSDDYDTVSIPATWPLPSIPIPKVPNA